MLRWTIGKSALRAMFAVKVILSPSCAPGVRGLLLLSTDRGSSAAESSASVLTLKLAANDVSGENAKK
ncbi:MAG: hypothetical protein EAZ24_05210 [Burkholderiales bacterium]|nr:MAG: hypothetical protein EAZ24_05210 [Burkholderiales bacterium]TAG80709.1 MAG: hypothetical protein EAZ21_07720 [Betaproteobacteria bacterium]